MISLSLDFNGDIILSSNLAGKKWENSQDLVFTVLMDSYHCFSAIRFLTKSSSTALKSHYPPGKHNASHF